VDRCVRLCAQMVDESLDLDRLRTEITGDVERIADHDTDTGMAAGEPGEGPDVVPAIGAGERHERLSETERIGESHADAAVADIEAHPSPRRLIAGGNHTGLVGTGGSLETC
jgi:hypothetical protein